MKKFSVLIAITVSIAFLYSFTSVTLPDPWVVPDKYLKMKNPVKADAASIKAGKLLYEKHCQSCHGKTGKGDGSKAAQLDTEPGDFSAKAFKSQLRRGINSKMAANNSTTPEPIRPQGSTPSVEKM